jgi:ribosomal protein L11 methyltransferase
MSNTPVYIELSAEVQPLEPFRDLIIAQLGEVGFESFSETETGFLAYINKSVFNADDLQEALYWEGVVVTHSLSEIEQVNWNEEWEKNFDPIDVDGRVFIHAPFHAPKQGYEHVMLIEPKMSFGTGHHQTTHMMIQWTLEEETQGKDVLDMGCGTGILGVLAGMRGAATVHGIDIDTWCIDNTLENAQRNGIPMTATQGGAEAIDQTYDFIYANINLNVLLADMEVYANALRPGGTILFSGFYEGDVPVLAAKAAEYGLSLKGQKAKDLWRSLKMVK